MKKSVLLLFSLGWQICSAGDTRLLEPAELWNGPENVKIIESMAIASVESVSVSPRVEVRIIDGRVQTREVKPLGWDERRELRVDAGPVTVPESLRMRLKAVLMVPMKAHRFAFGCTFEPKYRLRLVRDRGTAELILTHCPPGAYLYLDGRRVGGHLCLEVEKELLAIESDFDRLLSSTGCPPNQSLEPTTPAVTIPAAREVAPAGVVAHL